ncbi:hypothetical protein C8Q78DRAFT_1046854 [Trametes maxima]|nr:hypothetical protein C8Q78DRAFT_1046854 [Trametes maxima]
MSSHSSSAAPNASQRATRAERAYRREQIRRNEEVFEAVHESQEPHNDPRFQIPQASSDQEIQRCGGISSPRPTSTESSPLTPTPADLPESSETGPEASETYGAYPLEEPEVEASGVAEVGLIGVSDTVERGPEPSMPHSQQMSAFVMPDLQIFHAAITRQRELRREHQASVDILDMYHRQALHHSHSEDTQVTTETIPRPSSAPQLSPSSLSSIDHLRTSQQSTSNVLPLPSPMIPITSSASGTRQDVIFLGLRLNSIIMVEPADYVVEIAHTPSEAGLSQSGPLTLAYLLRTLLRSGHRSSQYLRQIIGNMGDEHWVGSSRVPLSVRNPLHQEPLCGFREHGQWSQAIICERPNVYPADPTADATVQLYRAQVLPVDTVVYVLYIIGTDANLNSSAVDLPTTNTTRVSTSLLPLSSFPVTVVTGGQGTANAGAASGSSSQAQTGISPSTTFDSQSQSTTTHPLTLGTVAVADHQVLVCNYLSSRFNVIAEDLIVLHHTFPGSSAYKSIQQVRAFLEVIKSLGLSPGTSRDQGRSVTVQGNLQITRDDVVRWIPGTPQPSSFKNIRTKVDKIKGFQQWLANPYNEDRVHYPWSQLYEQIPRLIAGELHGGTQQDETVQLGLEPIHNSVVQYVQTHHIQLPKAFWG